MPWPSKLITSSECELRQRLGQCARKRIIEGGYGLDNALKQQLQLLNNAFVAKPDDPFQCNSEGLECFAKVIHPLPMPCETRLFETPMK